MVEAAGVGLDDIAWIQRDEFIYYVEMAHALRDAGDWPAFRDELIEALNAAFGLDAAATSTGGDGASSWRSGLRRLLDRLREYHDPAVDWDGFSGALWQARHEIRPDL